MAAQSRGGVAAQALIAPAAAVAAADWAAIGLGRRPAEAVLKPLVPLLLAFAALPHWWLLAALLLCLAGDVLLLPQVDRFRSGLLAFLLGHLAFVGGLVSLGLHGLVPLAAAVLACFGAVLGARVLRAAPSGLRIPIAAYIAVILAMAAVALATGLRAALAGAALFLASDSLLAWNRFVRPLPAGRLGTMVTYHLALGLLTIASWS